MTNTQTATVERRRKVQAAIENAKHTSRCDPGVPQLPEDLVADIRAMAKAGVRQTVIAEICGLSVVTVWKLMRFENPRSKYYQRRRDDET